VAAPNRLLQQLPDLWRLEYDLADSGVTRGFHQADYDDWHWPQAATYSDTLDAQGLPDRQTVMWYRVTIDVPDDGSNAADRLFFAEVDGDVWVNGREVGASEKKRTPFSVDVSGAVKPGRNTIAVRVDHSNITDLYLGGILRPVLLVDRGS
jgi:beta-galactosidase